VSTSSSHPDAICGNLADAEWMRWENKDPSYDMDFSGHFIDDLLSRLPL
jgi:hypothetical protein